MKQAANLTLFDLPKRNAAANKLDAGDRPVHDWYRFVLSFPPHLVRQYLQRLGAGPNNSVLDPFCGTGTTLVECKKLGIPAIGIEANPMLHFASSVKVDWALDPEGLLRHARLTAERALTNLNKEGIEDEPAPKNQRATIRLRSLPNEPLKLLLTDSISPIPLHKTLALLEAINSQQDSVYYRHELLALAKALVTTIGNLEFGPEVGVGPPKKDALVIGSWRDIIREMAQDLDIVKQARGRVAQVYRGDSRTSEPLLREAKVDVVFTSPPYPNEKDYTRMTRLESVILGFIRTREDLRELKKRLIRSNTRNVYKNDRDDFWIAQHPEIQKIATTIERRRVELGKTSGFERLYHRVTKLYFGGIARHLTELQRILNPGARLGYVVGDQASYLRVMIRTGQLLANIAESLGYEVESIDLFRTRLATATREQLREEVVVLRWPGPSPASHHLTQAQTRCKRAVS